MIWIILIGVPSAFCLGLVAANGLTQPDKTNYTVLRLLIGLGTVVSGAVLGALTAFNSDIGASELLPWITEPMSRLTSPTYVFMGIGACCGLLTGLSAVFPIGED